MVWELLIIYRALQTVREDIDSAGSTIKDFLNDIETLLGVTTPKPKFLELILSHKKKIGIKFDSNLPNVVDMYAGLEPSTDCSIRQPDKNVLKLVEYKKYLNKFLQKQKVHLYVLFDRLDDFVVHEDYDTQKKLLQGLLSTQTDYRQKYPNIKIKSFFRTDLFRKLDLNEFGPDKILARCIDLNWSASELKFLMAKRIAHNLMNNLGLSDFEIIIDSDKFLVSREELPELTELKLSLTKFEPFKLIFWKRLLVLANLRGRSITCSNEGRKQNSSDLVNEAMITSIFPRQVIHTNQNGSEASIDIFDFFETHFQFAYGQTTPRVMLSFMNKSLTYARDYYNKNKDIQKIKKMNRVNFQFLLKKQ